MGSSHSHDLCSGQPWVQILFQWSTILTDVSRSFPRPIRAAVGIIPHIKLLAASLHRTWISVNAIDVLMCSLSTITNAVASTRLSATLRGGLKFLRTLSAVPEWDSEALCTQASVIARSRFWGTCTIFRQNFNSRDLAQHDHLRQRSAPQMKNHTSTQAKF